MNDSGINSNQLLIGITWVISLILVGFVSYNYGRAGISTRSNANKPQLVLSNTASPSPDMVATSTPNLSPTPSAFCSKTGFAQKWEYLTSYTVKQGDTLENIAVSQLGDSSRVNEILQLNGVGPLVAGSTLYLPPSTISKSSGNLREVYGKLVEKNSISWHINFSSDENSQGILIPSFWFDTIANKDSFKIGDCVKVFFEDGYKVYSVSLQ
ncbi:MAG TPA: LysM peptidoglycan-binding domain-containing protein [Patescibacteria group bacterium]